MIEAQARDNLQETRKQVIKELADDPKASFEQVKNLCDVLAVIDDALNRI